MVNNENILQELQEISTAVASIGNQNVYTVPAGYFEALADEVLTGVLMASRPVMPSPFNAPNGYFDGLAAAIMQKIHAAEPSKSATEIFEELEEVAPLLNTVSKVNVYQLPENYFENLANSIQNKIEAARVANTQLGVFEELEQIAPLLNSIGKKNTLSVPTGYFENLADGFIKASIQVAEPALHNDVFEELEQIAPMLNSISKKLPYSVPENYFEQFSVNIHAEKPSTKVVQMHRAKTKWVAWLAAACITAVMATGAFLYWQGDNAKGTPASFTKNLATVSDKEISDYLNTMPSQGIETIQSSVIDEQAPQVEPVIQNIGTDEIKDYLDKNSDPGEKKS